MTPIRHPAVAGTFYPADPVQLHRSVQGYLQAAAIPVGSLPKAIVAPHAGYVYSGPVAASVYRSLQAGGHAIRRVILIGPSHRVGFRGIALCQATAYASPLGQVPIDRSAYASLKDLAFVGFLDEAHAHEHSLEVQLPFLQEVLGSSFSLVPLVAGEATPEQVSVVLERLWQDTATLLVISSDLSHYHDYATAQGMDQATSRAIEHLQMDAIDNESACGRVPLRGLLFLAKRKGWTAQTVDLRNSGDTAGGKDRVVGYGAYVFH